MLGSIPAPVVLASASPRRQELFKTILPVFSCCPAEVKEILPKSLALEKGPEFLAEKKAKAVAAQYSDSIVLGCDTGVFLDGIMLGKPRDAQEAEEMLLRLSNRTHQVITGCCLLWGQKARRFSQKTQVTFYPLSPQEVRWYISTGEPFDKAGAYGIQGKGSLFIQGIQGDFFNVVGLPIAALTREMEKFIQA